MNDLVGELVGKSTLSGVRASALALIRCVTHILRLGARLLAGVDTHA